MQNENSLKECIITNTNICPHTEISGEKCFYCKEPENRQKYRMNPSKWIPFDYEDEKRRSESE